MMMFKHGFKQKTFAVLFFLTSLSLSAQTINVKVGDGETIKLTPSGRFYYDGAVYFEDKTALSNGTALTDLRLGLKAKYKMLDAKIDIGYSGGKIGAKLG